MAKKKMSRTRKQTPLQCVEVKFRLSGTVPLVILQLNSLKQLGEQARKALKGLASMS